MEQQIITNDGVIYDEGGIHGHKPMHEAIWLRQLMDNVGCIQKEATIIMCNNQGSIALAKNPTNHDRLKHIDV